MAPNDAGHGAGRSGRREGYAAHRRSPRSCVGVHQEDNLQDKVNKRMINSDEKLRALFGKGSVSMFEMNKLLQGHLKKA